MSAAEIVMPVRADIIGSDKCEAEGYSARGSSPVLAICRRLLAAGFNPGRALYAYRGEVLCLIVRSIGAGAALTVKERPNSLVFETWKPFSAPPVSPPMRATVMTDVPAFKGSLQ